MSDLESLIFDNPAVASRYAPVSRIGGDASSSVYEAVQRSTGQRVAVKVRLFEEGTPPVDYPWTVRSTWELSLKRLEAEAPQAAQLLYLVATWCHASLWRLVRPGWARRDDAGSWHAFAILLLLVIVFAPGLKRDLQVIVPLCFFVPLLVQFVDPIVGTVFPALRGRMAK